MAENHECKNPSRFFYFDFKSSWQAWLLKAFVRELPMSNSPCSNLQAMWDCLPSRLSLTYMLPRLWDSSKWAGWNTSLQRLLPQFLCGQPSLLSHLLEHLTNGLSLATLQDASSVHCTATPCCLTFTFICDGSHRPALSSLPCERVTFPLWRVFCPSPSGPSPAVL